MRRIIEKYNLLTDLVALVAVYMLLGGTLTALVAGAMCGLFVSILLHIANNEEDYLYLYDLRDFLRSKLTEAKDLASAYGQLYREKKGPQVEAEA